MKEDVTISVKAVKGLTECVIKVGRAGCAPVVTKSLRPEGRLNSLQHAVSTTINQVMSRWFPNRLKPDPELEKFEPLLEAHCAQRCLDKPRFKMDQKGDRWDCRVWVGSEVGESSGEKFIIDAKGRACQNWLNIHGGRSWRPVTGRSVFDDTGEPDEPDLSLLESVRMKNCKAGTSLTKFDKLLTSSAGLAQIKDGLKIMKECTGQTSRETRQDSRKNSPSKYPAKTETQSLLKAVFDSSCGSEVEMTPLKGSHGLGKRAHSSPRNSTTESAKRLKCLPDDGRQVDSIENIEVELPLADRLLDGSDEPTPSQEAKAATKVPVPKSKKSLFDFGRFTSISEEKSAVQSEVGTGMSTSEKYLAKSAKNISSKSSSEKEKKARPAKSGAKAAPAKDRSSKLPKENVEPPCPPPADLQNLVGSQVFGYESDDSIDSKNTSKRKAKTASRVRRQQQEVKRRQSRTIAKMAEYSQTQADESSEEEESKSRQKMKKARSKVGSKKAQAVDKSQRRMDGFLTRPTRGKVDVNELLRMPEELVVEEKDDAEDILQEEKIRVVEAKLERSVRDNNKKS